MSNHKIDATDLDAAARGLKMATVSDVRLQEIIGLHRGSNIFASQVIFQAAMREMISRCVQRMKSPLTHDDHRGMGTGQATWRNMWAVAVLEDGDWWIHLQGDSEQRAAEHAMKLMQSMHFGPHNVRLVAPDHVVH